MWEERSRAKKLLVATCEILRLDPGNPEVAEEEGNRSETPTRLLRSRLILREDRTDPIAVNHYYVIYAAIVKSFKTCVENTVVFV